MSPELYNYTEKYGTESATQLSQLAGQLDGLVSRFEVA